MNNGKKTDRIHKKVYKFFLWPIVSAAVPIVGIIGVIGSLPVFLSRIEVTPPQPPIGYDMEITTGFEIKNSGSFSVSDANFLCRLKVMETAEKNRATNSTAIDDSRNFATIAPDQAETILCPRGISFPNISYAVVEIETSFRLIWLPCNVGRFLGWATVFGIETPDVDCRVKRTHRYEGIRTVDNSWQWHPRLIH